MVLPYYKWKASITWHKEYKNKWKENTAGLVHCSQTVAPVDVPEQELRSLCAEGQSASGWGSARPIITTDVAPIKRLGRGLERE